MFVSTQVHHVHLHLLLLAFVLLYVYWGIANQLKKGAYCPSCMRIWRENISGPKCILELFLSSRATSPKSKDTQFSIMRQRVNLRSCSSRILYIYLC